MSIAVAQPVRHVLASMLLAASCVPASPALAQPEIAPAEMRRCATIERSLDRLDCYDALAATLDTGPEPADDAASVNENQGSAAQNVDAFGAELISDRNGDSSVEQIESRIIGEFSGWRGSTLFRLENGQVWQQSDQTRFVYHADSPTVTIRRAAFGSYRLRVDDMNRSVRVRRIE